MTPKSNQGMVATNGLCFLRGQDRNGKQKACGAKHNPPNRLSPDDPTAEWFIDPWLEARLSVGYVIILRVRMYFVVFLLFFRFFFLSRFSSGPVKCRILQHFIAKLDA